MRFDSLDVINLYGSLPLNDNTFPGVLTIVADFFEKWKTLTPLHGVCKQDFHDLLNLSLTSDTILAKTSTFKQVDGLQMGNSVSSPCAVIFMNFIEEQMLSSIPQPDHYVETLHR